MQTTRERINRLPKREKIYLPPIGKIEEWDGLYKKGDKVRINNEELTVEKAVIITGNSFVQFGIFDSDNKYYGIETSHLEKI